MLNATMLKGSNVGGGDMRVLVQVCGSYDGRAWQTAGLPFVTFDVRPGETAAGPETAYSSKVAVDFAMLRVAVSVESIDSSGAALVAATLSFFDR